MSHIYIYIYIYIYTYPATPESQTSLSTEFLLAVPHAPPESLAAVRCAWLSWSMSGLFDFLPVK